MKLGCNYWASNAGTDMWTKFDSDAIREDMKVLSENGVEYLRVFPNWRDFQPVEPLYSAGTGFMEYRLSGDRFPQNKYYLDELMLERFGIFCDIAEEYGMKLIVGLITGFMSGRTFVPPVLYGKNLSNDYQCLYFEQLFVEGFVERFREKSAIYAWDHGNECQNMLGAENYENATMWTKMITNCIRVKDSTRPVISGINAMELNGRWTIEAQADACDILVSHPYPFWGVHTTIDKNDYIRTIMYPTAHSKLYSDIGGKPCLVEEVGTMGPSVCSEDFAADFLRVQFFSIFANGGNGVLWWCANEQIELDNAPFTWTTVENELGMRFKDGTPKPVLKEMKRLSELNFDFELPKIKCDAVCLLSQKQDNWGVAYMSFILAKQAGLEIDFADAASGIPAADTYMLPSVKGNRIMPKERLNELKKRVYDGAKLYISFDDGILSEFEEWTGNKILDSEIYPYSDKININGKEIQFTAGRKLFMENTRAEAVQTPYITRASYGKGEVYFVAFPVESMLIDKHRAFDGNVSEIYKEIFKNEINSHAVKVNVDNIALTVHEEEDRLFAIAINHSEMIQKIELITDYKIKKIHYGDLDNCQPLDAVIVEFEK